MDGERRRRVAIAQKEIDRIGIDFRNGIVRGQDGANLRAKSQPTIGQSVVDELDAHGIAGHDQALVRRIPDGKPEHAVEMIEDIRAPFLVAVDDHFGVGVGSEFVTQVLGARRAAPCSCKFRR